MKLSNTQKNVIKLVVQGLTNAQIAQELSFSEANIKKNLQKIYKSFKVQNRSSLVREALSAIYSELI